MAVKLESMMKKLFTPKERAAIRRDAGAIAKRAGAGRAAGIVKPKKKAT